MLYFCSLGHKYSSLSYLPELCPQRMVQPTAFLMHHLYEDFNIFRIHNSFSICNSTLWLALVRSATELISCLVPWVIKVCFFYHNLLWVWHISIISCNETFQFHLDRNSSFYSDFISSMFSLLLALY